MKRYYVYILRCLDGTYYTGVTGDFEQRIAQHHYGAFPKCYTFVRRPLELVWSQEYDDIYAAIAGEKKLKKMSHNQKSAFIRGDFEMYKKLRRKKRH